MRIFLYVLFLVALTGCGGHSEGPEPSTKEASAFTIDGQTYTVKVDPATQDAHFIKVTKGLDSLIWSPSPKLKQGSTWFKDEPLSPFTVYSSPLDQHELTPATSTLLFTLPLTVKSDVPQGHLYEYLRNLYTTSHWVVYNVDFMNPGMNQSKYSELDVYDRNKRTTSTAITYHNAGGYHFRFGLDRDQLYYEYTQPQSGGSEAITQMDINLNTGEKRTYTDSEIRGITFHDT